PDDFAGGGGDGLDGWDAVSDRQHRDCVVDPEMKKEFEEHQKKSPISGALAGGAAGGNPLQNFDMAAWMAGTPAKSGAAQSEGAAKPRRKN
ncbi:MAG: hypothetical protein LQ347_006488, partial [Umbilicaria vellea]